MKIIFYVIIAAITVSVLALCPNGCATCTSPLSCSICQPGNFLVNNTFCPRCPYLCTNCTADASFRPVCSACALPAQLDASNRCFLCDPSCLTCIGTPKNCTTCPDGNTRQIDTVGLGFCGRPPNCLIPNCGSCGLDLMNNTICTRCLFGYFPYLKSCFPCKFPCSSCSFNMSNIWTNIISPYWNQTLRASFNISTLVPTPGILPQYASNLDFANMPPNVARNWQRAYFAVKVINLYLPSTTSVIAQTPSQILFINSILNLNVIDQ
mgnify:FL=1